MRPKIVNEDIVRACMVAGFAAAPSLGTVRTRDGAVDAFTRAALEHFIDHLADVLVEALGERKGATLLEVPMSEDATT